MTRLMTVLLAGIVTLALAAPAGAVAPDISRYGFSLSDRVDPAVCGFGITALIEGKGQSFVFTGRDGTIARAKATGPISVRFTNDRTGATARYSISGPSFYDADGALIRGTGRWYVFTAGGRPAIAMGNLTFDDTGAPRNPSHTVDICDALS